MSLSGRPSVRERPQRLEARQRENAAKKEAIVVAIAEVAGETGRPRDIRPCKCGWTDDITLQPFDPEGGHPMLVARCAECRKIVNVTTFAEAEDRDAAYERVRTQTEQDGGLGTPE